MRKSLQAPKGTGLPVLRFKYDSGCQLIYQAALSGDPKLFGEITADVGNRFHLHCNLEFQRSLGNTLAALPVKKHDMLPGDRQGYLCPDGKK